MRIVLGTLWRSVALAGVSALVALVFNLVRAEGLEMVARAPYDIYTDCPELSKEATGVEMKHLEEDLSPFTIIDARATNAFLEAHVPGARSMPYSPLFQMEDDLVDELRELGPNRVLVYGDVTIESGRLMAGELSSLGLLGVRYIKGGYGAWLAAGRRTESGGEQ